MPIGAMSAARAGAGSFLVGLLLLAGGPAAGFDVLPAQPGASTTYRFTDIYTLAGGAQRAVALNPAGVEILPRGGSDSFLATLRAEFPDWTFNAASSDLAGTFTIQNYYACGLGTLDCGTEQGVPDNIIGSFVDVTYNPAAGDPTAAANELHWIQRLFTNHALGAGGGHGVNEDKVDNDSSPAECANVPYYDCGFFAGETFLVDRPSRSGDSANDHVWGAEVYLVEQTAPRTVTIYNGIKWGWLNTDSDIRTLIAPPSAIVFDNPNPAVGGGVAATGIGTNSITWGTAAAGSFASALAIRSSALEVRPLIGEPFVVGTVTYSNGTIVSGSGLSSIRMTVRTTIDVPDMEIAGLAVEDARVVTMINTPNTCDAHVAGDCTEAEARESADYVTVPPAADLTSVPAAFPNFSELGNNFHVREESSATATLVGRITEAKIAAASGGGGGGGLLRPLAGAPAPAAARPRKLVLEVLGFGKVLEGRGFITKGLPGPSVEDAPQPPLDPGRILVGGGTVTIGFDARSGNLTRGSLATLEKVVRLLKSKRELTIEVEGFSDNKGSANAKLALSSKFADQVRRYLVSRGIPAERFRVRALGDKMPVATNKTENGRQMNRRVEIKLADKTKK